MKKYVIFAFCLYAHTLVAQRPFVLDTVIDVPNAGAGRCYSRCWEMDTSILVTFIPEKRRKEMSRVELHPAYTYYALKQNALVAPLQKGEIVRSEPPKYDIIRGKHKVQDARTKWIRKRESKECLSYDTSFCLVLCLVEVPAEYWTYTLQVLKEPAKIIRQRSDTILIELLDSTSQLLTKVEVPPQYKTVELSFEENPAHYRVESNKEIEIAPATLRIKSDKNLTNVLFEWREVLCSDGDSWLTVQIIQKTLNKKGYKLKEDNIMGKATKKAIIDFQKKNGFPIGNLNIETLKALVLNDL